MDSSDKKFYRLNLTVSEDVDWESTDLYCASYHCVGSKDDAIRLAKQIFEILCSAYYDGYEDAKKEFTLDKWDADDEDW